MYGSTLIEIAKLLVRFSWNIGISIEFTRKLLWIARTVFLLLMRPTKLLLIGTRLGMMKGNLTEKISKGDKNLTRKLNDDFSYCLPSGNNATLKGRSLMLVRNVGHLMTTPTVLDHNGDEVFEGLLDAMYSHNSTAATLIELEVIRLLDQYTL